MVEESYARVRETVLGVRIISIVKTATTLAAPFRIVGEDTRAPCCPKVVSTLQSKV